MKTSIPKLPAGDVLVHKYGCRLDADCLEVVQNQITLARRMYNDLVADMRKAVEARSAREIELGGQPAQVIQARIIELNSAFDAAKAANDELAMKSIAESRRGEWRAMSAVLNGVRAAHKAELKNYIARIGKNSACTTYQIRGQYVAAGLGWATANAVLDNALQAFQSTMKTGQAPRFAKGSEITRDTLSLQFTTAGGVPAEKLISGAHNEIWLKRPRKGYGKRCYGEFLMRMGAARDNTAASGTWQAHRPLPEGSHVAGASLVREKVGSNYQWNIQLLIKLPARRTAPVNATREPLAALHLGWSADDDGRRIGAIASSADEGLAQIIRLPEDIEPQIRRSAAIKSTRDSARDAIVPVMKSLPKEVVAKWPEALQEEFASLKRLPVSHVAASRLHRLWWMLYRADCITPGIEALDAFTAWRKADKLNQQAEVGLAKSARARRKDFYRTLALRQCQQYESILLDQPDLKEAAEKVDKKTGEKTELGAKARSGRVVAALYEYVEALKWAATRCGTALIEVDGSTASVCSTCGAEGLKTVEGTQHQQQECPSCGAVHDRKSNAAAVIYQAMAADVHDLSAQAMASHRDTAAEAAAAKNLKAEKLLQARRNRAALANGDAVSADLQ